MQRISTSRPVDRPQGGIAYGFLENLIGFWIRRASIKTLQSFRSHLKDVKLSPAKAAALLLIEANPGLSQNTLAAAFSADQSTVVGLLLSLEKRGLIARERHEKDRRYQMLSLTKEGKVVVRKVKLDLLHHNESMQEGLTLAERRSLLNLLQQFVGR